MQLDFDYANACHPDKWKVLGRVLCDFTAGHLLLLQRMQSPYITGAPGANIADLLTAVEICSVDWRRAVKMLWKGNTLRARMRARAWAWIAYLRPDYIRQTSEAFEEYIASAHRAPRGIFKKQDAPKTFAPLIPLFFHDLREQYGFEEMLDQPLRKIIFERYHLLTLDKTVDWPWHLQAPKVEEAARG